jgi:hypothetical protein
MAIDLPRGIRHACERGWLLLTSTEALSRQPPQPGIGCSTLRRVAPGQRLQPRVHAEAAGM